MKVANALCRDDTEHGVYYYLASEVDSIVDGLTVENEHLTQLLAEANREPGDGLLYAMQSQKAEIERLTTVNKGYETQANEDCLLISKLTAERDAAFAMSGCECESNEACANLVQHEAERDALQTKLDDALVDAKRYEVGVRVMRAALGALKGFQVYAQRGTQVREKTDTAVNAMELYLEGASIKDCLIVEPRKDEAIAKEPSCQQ